MKKDLPVFLAKIHIVGVMMLGLTWFFLCYIVALFLVPVGYGVEKKWTGMLISLFTLIAILTFHALTCWRVVEDMWLGPKVDYIFGISTLIILTGLGMMPFRLHRLYLSRRESRIQTA